MLFDASLKQPPAVRPAMISAFFISAPSPPVLLGKRKSILLRCRDPTASTFFLELSKNALLEPGNVDFARHPPTCTIASIPLRTIRQGHRTNCFGWGHENFSGTHLRDGEKL